MKRRTIKPRTNQRIGDDTGKPPGVTLHHKKAGRSYSAAPARMHAYDVLAVTHRAAA
jgi:hypothetical protein